MHSTNYFNTFIRVAVDCPRKSAEVPPDKAPKSIARRSWELLTQNPPYTYTSDELLYQLYTERHGDTPWEKYWAKGRACLRCSPLGKRYGWGLHFDAEGQIAVLDSTSKEYAQHAANKNLTQKTAMKLRR